MAFDLPLPKVVADVEAGGPYVTAARGLNKLRKEELENQFYPEHMRAENASKNAYAKFVGPQMIAQILGGAAAGNLSPEEYQKYVKQMTGMLQPDQQNNASQAPQQSNSLAGRAWNLLMDKVNPPTNKQQPLAQSSLPQPSSSNPFASTGSGTMLSEPPEYEDLRRKAEQGGRPSASSPVPINNGNVPSNRPKTMNELRLEQRKNSKVEEKNEVRKNDIFQKQWDKSLEKDNEEAAVAQSMEDQLDNFNSAYDKTSEWEKGPVLGRNPIKFSDEAQIANSASSDLMTTMARLKNSGHITNRDFEYVKPIKPSLNMGDKARKDLSLYIKGAINRSYEKPQFSNAAKQLGLDAHQSNILWSKYINSRPFYDPKTRKLNQDNIGTWGDFLTPQYVNSVISPKGGSKGNKQESASSSSEEEKPSQTRTLKNGETVGLFSDGWHHL